MSPATMGKIELGIRLALDFAAAANAGNAERLSSLFEPGGMFRAESAGPDGEGVRGREEIRRYFEARFASAPGERFEIVEALGLGYRSVLRWRLRKEGHGGDGGSGIEGVWIFSASQMGIREIHAYRKA